MNIKKVDPNTNTFHIKHLHNTDQTKSDSMVVLLYSTVFFL